MRPKLLCYDVSVSMTSNKSAKALPARIHLLVAREAPIVVVIRRKPSRLVHILRWNTKTDEFEAGSWFSGRIYAMRSDVSFDGRYMVYLAMGTTGETWTGVCQLPFLRTVIDWPNQGTWHGGGLFQSATRLEINPGYSQPDALEAISKLTTKLPFDFGILANSGYGEDEGILYPRFQRDGFRRLGPFGEEETVVGSKNYTVLCKDDPGWVTKPSPKHPELRVRYRGYSGGRGRIFEWDLPDHPELLDRRVDWAMYDSLGQLIVARAGILYRYTLDDLLGHQPSGIFDLETLERPVVPVAKNGTDNRTRDT